MIDPLVVWAAGFFDGEGCVLLARMRPRTPQSAVSLRLGIAVAQKVREPLDTLAQRWGGTVRLSHESRTNRHADAYDWRLHGAAAVVFLRDVRPYLRVKHRQADVGIAYGMTIGEGRRVGKRGVPAGLAAMRERLFIELRALNRRGRAV